MSALARARAQVLIVDKVGGIEDIPHGVSAILTRSATDLLSHIAIRARNQGVLLATCHDDAAFAALKSLTGSAGEGEGGKE